MFDIGGLEMLVVAVVAILVVGPKDLPGMLSAAGKYFRQAKQMANEFRGQMDSAIRDAELEEVKAGFQKVGALNPKNALKSGVGDLLGDDANLMDELDIGKDIQDGLNDAPAPAAAKLEADAASKATTKKPAVKKTATKRASAKTTTKKPTAKATTAKPAPKSAAAKSSAAQKAPAKKPATRKPAVKKTAAKTTAKSA